MKEKEVVMRYRNKLSLSVSVFLALLFLISCVAKPSVTEPPLILVNTPTIQIAPTPTEVMIEPTSTIFPTLDPDSAYAELQNIFRENRCELPCWWGIEPGTTSLPDAESKLSEYHRIAPSMILKNGLRLHLNVSILHKANSMQVNAVRITEEVLRDHERVYGEQVYTDLLGIYSLQKILNTYGRPVDIFTTIEIYNTEPNAPDFMMIWLLYPKEGLIVKYTANAELNNEIVTGCPKKSFFTFWLFPSDGTEDYKELNLVDPDLGYIFPALSLRTKPVSEAFGVSVDEFYKLFTESNNKCLETPYSIWPGW